MRRVRVLPFPPDLIINLTNIVVDITEMFLVLRLVLKLFGASSAAPFVRWVYDTTDPLLWPFRGIFPSPTLARGLVIDFSTIFAIIVYIFAGYIITEILEALMYHSGKRSNTRKEDKE